MLRLLSIPLLTLCFVLTFENISLADGIRPHECPKGKFFFGERPIAETSQNKKLVAAVLVRGAGLVSETYLHTRADGWTNLSTEKTRFVLFERVSNCLPAGNYAVRIEYYTHMPVIGEWLAGSLEYKIKLSDPAGFFEYNIATPVYKNATLKDHLEMHWPLFLFFILVMLALSAILTVAIILR